jgi:two-component system response regulator YesN
MFRILIVEDSRSYRESLKDILSEDKFSNVIVEEAENAREAIEKADSFGPNLIFMDIRLPDGSGIELTKNIKAKYPNVSVAMLTNYDGPEYREAALRNGASHFFSKGVVTRQEIQDLVKSSLSE